MPIYIPKIEVRYQAISETLTIKEYWNLIGQQPFLAPTCSFCRMLKDHKNFRFTPIPDKTNDLIFLKSQKNLFFGFF